MEEHGEGGLASAVAEVLALAGARCEFVPLRLAREPQPAVGSAEYLRRSHGLTTQRIVDVARLALSHRSK